MPNPHDTTEDHSHPPPLDTGTTPGKKKGKKLDDIIKAVQEIKDSLSTKSALERIEEKIDHLIELVSTGAGNLTPEQQAQIDQIDATVRANDAKLEAITTPGP